MTYYCIESITDKRTGEPDMEKENDYAPRYFADFEELLGSVYWRVITPLLEMRRGHLTKVLEITGYRMPGQLTLNEDSVTVATEHYTYLFEKTDANPLDETLKE